MSLVEKIGLLPHWGVNDSIQDNLDYNLDAGSSGEGQRRIDEMRRPISGLHRLVLYYPIGGYKQRVEYYTPQSISPMQVLESINAFYALPITQANIDALAAFDPELATYPVDEEGTIGELNPDRPYLDELKSYQDGFLVVLR